MQTKTVRADWIEDQVFLLRDQFDFPVVMTQPNGVSGADLLPMSLIGCAAWDVISILRKQKQPVTALKVTADVEQDDDPPWRIRRIRIHYKLTGVNLNRRFVERAIELSETSYCSVHATLRAAVDISSDFEILEA